MKIELTEDLKFAISIAFDELSNCSDWQDYLDEGEYERVSNGRDYWEQLNEQS